ncbi:ABC transporter permease [Propionicicella superfundia]|uniref:ABC transporter permease n=1 Tax=Propionicicella superfundia TaxID=348582 RepID=UPI001FDEEA22|nr:ABC transporter permease [Propionicicella superfundia]
MVITPPGRLNLPRWRELWDAREVAYRFGQRDVILRYRQTAVGIVWVLLQPLVAAGIFSIVFGNLAGLPTDGVPYFLFSYIGMLAWNLFNGLVSRASGSLVANQALVAKVFFPRMLVPISSLFAVLLDFGVALVLGVVLLVVYGVNPGWGVLLMPVWLVCLLMFALGISLAASAWMVKYRDVTYVIPWLLQVGLYATPIAYSLSAVPEAFRWLFYANPLAWLVELFRASMLGTTPSEAWLAPAAVAASVVVLFLGVLVFQSREREFADLI